MPAPTRSRRALHSSPGPSIQLSPKRELWVPDRDSSFSPNLRLSRHVDETYRPDLEKDLKPIQSLEQTLLLPSCLLLLQSCFVYSVIDLETQNETKLWKGSWTSASSASLPYIISTDSNSPSKHFKQKKTMSVFHIQSKYNSYALLSNMVNSQKIFEVNLISQTLSKDGIRNTSNQQIKNASFKANYTSEWICQVPSLT